MRHNTRLIVDVICAVVFCAVVAIGGSALTMALNKPKAPPPVAKVETITLDVGGELGAFINKFAKWRDDGVRVRIDGMCISACTMITGLIPEDRVCVTPRGRLAFHSASMGMGHSSEGTRLLWHVYPEDVRALLRTKGWDGDDKAANEHPDLIYVEGIELLAIYNACKET